MRLLALTLLAAALSFRCLSQQAATNDIPITFARPQQVLQNSDVSFTSDAYFQPRADRLDRPGSFAQLVADHIAGVEVTWADDYRFRTDAQTTEFLHELLSNTKTAVYAGHIWSWGDGKPSVIATVAHNDGSKTKWIIWVQPIPYWSYEDENGLWWWGEWDTAESPRPASANIPGITPLPTTTISGHVIDDATGQPMAGAHVDISAGGVPCNPKDVIARDAPIPDCIRALEERVRIDPVTTGKDGAFRFEHVPIGQLTIHAEKPLLKNGSFISATLGPHDAPKPMEIDLHLSSMSSSQPSH